MPLRITEHECSNAEACGKSATGKSGKEAGGQQMVLKVQGSLYLEDAELLEKICRDVQGDTGCQLKLDLADLAFLDSESAFVLCRLKREQGVILDGLHLFIAKVIELTEAEAMVTQYLPKENVDQSKDDGTADTRSLETIARQL